MANKRKSYHRLERLVKGFANHRRIQIMDLIEKEPELSVLEISDKLDVNFKTVSDHIRRLVISGLVLKRNEGPNVRHKLTERGVDILQFLKTL